MHLTLQPQCKAGDLCAGSKFISTQKTINLSQVIWLEFSIECLGIEVMRKTFQVFLLAMVDGKIASAIQAYLL